jgi:hypothetical protein
MKYIFPGIKTAILLYLAYLVAYYAFVYPHEVQKVSPPFAVFALDSLTLIIHEAGHFFFRILGNLLYMMGGTLFQVLFPLGIAVWMWFKFREWTVFPLFWCGTALVNGAVYIADAQKMQLQLIGKGLKHDWYYIFSEFGALGAANEVGFIVHWLGALVMIAALAHGISHLVIEYRNAYLGIEEEPLYE